MSDENQPRVVEPRLPWRARQLAVAYLIVQGCGGAAWWGMLWTWPKSRQSFMASAAPDSTLLAFAMPDLVLYVGASWLAALGLCCRSGWAWPVLCLHCGATVYAALYCILLWRLDEQAWLAALIMAPPLVVVPLITWYSRPGSQVAL